MNMMRDKTRPQIIYYNGFVCEFKRLYISVCLSCKVNPLALGQCRIPRQHCEAVGGRLNFFSFFACWVQMKWNIHTCGHIYIYIYCGRQYVTRLTRRWCQRPPQWFVCIWFIYTYIYAYGSGCSLEDAIWIGGNQICRAILSRLNDPHGGKRSNMRRYIECQGAIFI